MTPFRLACLTALLFLLALPAAASADTSFQSGDTTGQISAHGDDLAYLGAGGSNGRLYLGFGAAARTVPVASRAGFFGIDLGTDSKGRSTLIYSRCSKGARCDLFTYRLGSRKERKLKSLSRSRCTERNPALVRGTVVFVREKHRSRKRRLRCAGGIFRKRPGKRLRRIARIQPFELDFDGKQLAYKQSFSGGDEIRVLRPGHRSRRLARGLNHSDPGGNFGTFLSSPVLDGGRVYWARSVHDEAAGTETGDVVRRVADGSGPEQVLDRTGRLYVSSANHLDTGPGAVAVSGDHIYYTYSAFRIGRVAGTPVFH